MTVQAQGCGFAVRKRRRGLAAALTLVLAIGAARESAFADVPFWGERQSMPADTPISQLRHGQFIWMGDALRSGPLLLVVSITEQRAYLYRNGLLIGATTVSTGRRGHETPTGVFTILQKDKDHRSTIYDSAPMPFMERLTWGGVALHAGGLPGYPESHGCVHLPSEFAQSLFGISSTGMTVVIATDATEPSEVAHPGFLAPIDAAGRPLAVHPLQPTESLRWQPEDSPTGPVSIVLSRGSGRIVVYRGGVEIGRARAIFRGNDPVGTHVLTLVEGAASGSTRFLPDPAHEHWMRVGIAGHQGEAGSQLDALAAARVEIPDEFVRKVYGVLTPGTTVLVTDEAILPTTSGPSLSVVNADPQET